MKKTLLIALLFCLTPFLGLAQQPAGTAAQHDEAIFGPGPVSKALPSQIQMNLMKGRSGSDEVWGYAMLVPETNENYGYYYSITGSGGITALRKYPGLYFSAAEYHKPYPATGDDEVFPVWAYASDLTQGFHRLMVEDGTDNNTLSPVTMNLHDMTYDYIHNAPGQEGRMLGILYGKIYLVNTDWSTPYAGSTELLYDPADHPEIGRPVALACNLKGELYFVSISEDGTEPSKLYMFEDDDEYLEDPIEVGELGWAAQHIQTMAFNHHEGDRLYWWQCDKDNNTNLVEIDPETAETTLVAATGNTEISGLVFKFEYRPYTAYCLGDALGEIRLKSGGQYTLTQRDYLPMETVEFKAVAGAHHAISRVKVLKHDTEEVLLTIEASDLADGSGSFDMPDCDIDLSCEWEGKENGITYEWTPDDVEGLDINGPAVGSYNELVTFNYMTDFNGYILTGLTAQSGETTLTVRKLSPNVDGMRQIKMPDGEVVITGTYEAIGLEQLENICQYTPARVPAYNVPPGVTKAELKVRKPGADWTLFADEDWADGEVFDAAGIWQYRAELTNIYGTFAEELSFEVYAAPKGMAIEGIELVCENGELSLGVVPDPAETDMSAGTFQWFKDGEEIAGATEAQLTVSPAALADAGSYTVSYSNGDGLCQFETEPFEVTVPELPEITWLQPEDGDNAVLIAESIELEAIPEGGSYSYLDPATGETVDLTDNIFTFPGAGEFELTYHYEDEYGCANEASVNLNVVQHHFIYYQEKDNYSFPENFTLDGANTYTVDEADILYGVAGDVMTLSIEVPECNHLVSMDINARDESGNVYTIYNATEPVNPYTFMMPAESFFANTYYVTVDAGWAPNEYDITASSTGPVLNCPPTGICGEDVTVEYENVEDYILCDFAVEGSCESLIETAVTLPDQITFTMPDCAVSVFSYYEPISLGQLDDICQWQAPGVPSFATSSNYYTSYTYKVQKPGSNEWIEFTEDDWNNDFLFDVAGSWNYYVALTNRYGTFISAEMNFAVVAAPEIVEISGYNKVCEHNYLLLNVEYQPDDGSTSGSIQWYKDGEPLNSETLEYLIINDCSLGDAGSYMVIYTNDYCQYMSKPYEVTVHPLPEVAWVEPEDGAMITGSIELQATPEGGTFYYLNSAGTSGGWQEITGNTFTFPEVGQYFLKYYYEDENGCANESEVRTVNVGSEVHLIDGTGGTLSLSGTQTIFMPGDPVVVNGTPNDCMHITDITVYKTGDHSVMVTSSFDDYSGECTFEMPEYDVDVVAGWGTNRHHIDYSGFVTGFSVMVCGEDLYLNFDYIPEGSILLGISVQGSCGSDIPLTFNAGECWFTMPDCDVEVSSGCQTITISNISNFCQWQAPGVPDFNIFSEYYTSYTYKVKKPGSTEWIDFNDDDWADGNNFDVAGVWTYCVALTNDYGTFESEQKTFEVYEVPESIAIECSNNVANLGTSITLSVVPTPSTFNSFRGTFQWFKDGTEIATTIDPILTINSCELSDEGDYTVTYRHFNPDIPVEGLTYDFEDHTMQGWTTIDADGDGNNWLLVSSQPDADLFDYHNNSSDMVISRSYDEYTQTALLPDNYLVSPQIVLGGFLSFYACAQDPNYAAEHFGVAVSTSGNTSASDFTTIQEWTMTAKSVGATANATHNGNRFNINNWYQYTVDLSDYFGQTGYVAIRHFNCTDIFILNVDDIRIATPFDGVDLCEFTSDSFRVEVIEEESSYSITYHPDNNLPENGFVSGPTASTAGADVTVSLSPATGYNCTALKYTYTDIAGLQEFNINPVNNEAHFTMVPYDVDVWAQFTPIDWTFTLYYMLEGTTTQVATPYTGIFHYNDAINVPSPNVTGLVPLTDPYVGVMPNNHFVDTVYYTGDIFEVVFCEDLQAMPYVLSYSTDHTNNLVQALTYVTVNVELETGWSCNMIIKNYNTGKEIYNGYDNSVTFNMPLSDVMVCLEVTKRYWDDYGNAKDYMDINNTELKISLYPNPTNGDAKIVSDHAVIQRVTVYNLMGQAILDEEVNNTETMLHLNGVAKGVYMLKVSSEEGYAMKKVVIE